MKEWCVRVLCSTLLTTDTNKGIVLIISLEVLFIYLGISFEEISAGVHVCEMREEVTAETMKKRRIQHIQYETIAHNINE